MRGGADIGVYVRVGSTNRRADAEMVEELRRFARGDGFDEQPMPGLNSEAIDFRVASESFAAVRKLARRDLETLRLVTDHQGRKVPTVGGMLLFGKDREHHFPDAWIQAGRFDGTDKRRIVDSVEIRSFAVRSVEEAITFVDKHVLHGAEIGPVRRKERWSLPLDLVSTSLAEAVTHGLPWYCLHPVETAGPMDGHPCAGVRGRAAERPPTGPWKSLWDFHELPQGLVAVLSVM